MIALGGVLGTLGQGVRVIIGLKKVREEAAAANKPMVEGFRSRQLGFSLMIGFLAGAIANILIGGGTTGTGDVTASIVGGFQQHMLGLMAAGYAGTDFVEGVFRQRLKAV